MCTIAAKRLTAVILVEWNWNCTGVETYPVSDQTLFFRPGRSSSRTERMMLDGMIEHFFAPFPSDFQLCSSHTPLLTTSRLSPLAAQPLNQLVCYWDRRETEARLVCLHASPALVSHWWCPCNIYTGSTHSVGMSQGTPYFLVKRSLESQGKLFVSRQEVWR